MTDIQGELRIANIQSGGSSREWNFCSKPVIGDFLIPELQEHDQVSERTENDKPQDHGGLLGSVR